MKLSNDEVHNLLVRAEKLRQENEQLRDQLQRLARKHEQEVGALMEIKYKHIMNAQSDDPQGILDPILEAVNKGLGNPEPEALEDTPYNVGGTDGCEACLRIVDNCPPGTTEKCPECGELIEVL